MTRTLVFTGGTSGIGRIAAVHLLTNTRNFILVGRDEKKLAATCQAFEKISPQTRMDYYLADFSQLRTVDGAGARIARRFPSIDVLVNNAGQHAFTQRVTTDGFAEMISVNYLAPWLLTKRLIPSLKGVKHARIVNVASEASRRVKELAPTRDLYDTKPFSRLGSSVVYAKTKLMNIMFSAELARQLGSNGVVSNCLDPGFNVTALGRELPFAHSLERMLAFFGIGNPERGAAIIVRLATDPEFGMVTGQYYSRSGQKIALSPAARDPVMQRLLWEATEQVFAGLPGFETEHSLAPAHDR